MTSGVPRLVGEGRKVVMLERLARLAVARPKAVLAATLVLMAAAFVYGSGISERLSGGGFYSVSSESQRAAALAEQRFHAGKPNLVILATATGGEVCRRSRRGCRRPGTYSTACRHAWYHHGQLVLGTRQVRIAA